MIRVSVTGVKELRAELDAIAERVGNVSAPMKVSAEELKQLMDDGFRGSMSPDDEPWLPLQMLPPYKSGRKKPPRGVSRQTKRRRDPSSKPLVDTGNLRNAVYATGKNAGIEFGISSGAAAYGPTHQFGGGKYEQVPARPFLPVTPDGEVEMVGRFADWFERAKQRLADWVRKGTE